MNSFLKHSDMARDSHPHTNHTCIYSPAAEHHHPLAGSHCTYPRRDGQPELTCVTMMDVMDTK